jgi:hypothetical protein
MFRFVPSAAPDTPIEHVFEFGRVFGYSWGRL